MDKKRKTTGIIRRIDNLGRVVIPKEIRKALDIKEGDTVEIGLEGEQVYVKKPSIECKFCNNILTEEQLDSKFKICSNCQEEIKSL